MIAATKTTAFPDNSHDLVRVSLKSSKLGRQKMPLETQRIGDRFPFSRRRHRFRFLRLFLAHLSRQGIPNKLAERFPIDPASSFFRRDFHDLAELSF
jgi:hypothetical protein